VAYWQSTFELFESYPDVHYSFVRTIKPYVISATIAMLPLGLILDLAVWRYRHLAPWIVYFEIFGGIINGFTPYDYGGFMSLLVFITLAIVFVSLANDPGP